MMDQVFEAAVRAKVAKLEQQLAEAHKETDSVVYARDEAYRMLADMQEKCNVFQEKVFAMRDELATMTAAYDEQVTLHNKTLDELAECERERDEYLVNYKATKVQLENANETLATVTAERDELVAALEMVCKIECVDDLWKAQEALAKVGADKTGEASPTPPTNTDLELRALRDAIPHMQKINRDAQELREAARAVVDAADGYEVIDPSVFERLRKAL